MKKVGVIKCELCESAANTYCESDEASLCWECDHRVHAANFLVANHLRTLLCHHCQAHTSWNASGPTLLPSLSFCLNCTTCTLPHSHDDNDYDDDGDDDDDDGYDEEDEEEDEPFSDNDDENQVVPWIGENYNCRSHCDSS